MYQNGLLQRTKQIALDVFRLLQNIPKNPTSDVLYRQIIRSATSVGANYRAACRARSKLDFVAKMKIVEEELDETVYWIELYEDMRLVQDNRFQELKMNMNIALAMVVSSIKTARGTPNR